MKREAHIRELKWPCFAHFTDDGRAWGIVRFSNNTFQNWEIVRTEDEAHTLARLWVKEGKIILPP